MFKDGANWPDMVALECEACHKERKARTRVVYEEDDLRFHKPPYDAAPYIHPNSLPKYVALQLRALAFATERHICVNWITAHDKPLHHDDLALSE